MQSADVESLSLSSTLAPFLAIVRSPLSTGPITSAALSSLHNLFVCKYISANSVDLEVALAELSSTVSNCKFEASDSAGDEAVMLKIMAVIEDCMCGSVGGLLGDVEVCEMLETVLTTCCQMRLSGKRISLCHPSIYILTVVVRALKAICRIYHALHCPGHVCPSPKP